MALGIPKTENEELREKNRKLSKLLDIRDLQVQRLKQQVREMQDYIKNEMSR